MSGNRGTSWPVMRLRGRLRREGGTRICAWCLQPVDLAIPSGPESFELDHIQPKKYGGDDSPANLRCLHRRCNRARRDGRPNPRLRAEPVDRSAAW